MADTDVRSTGASDAERTPPLAKPRHRVAPARLWTLLGAAVIVVLGGIYRNWAFDEGGAASEPSLVVARPRSRNYTRTRSAAANFSSARLAAASGAPLPRPRARQPARIAQSGASVRPPVTRRDSTVEPSDPLKLREQVKASAAYWDSQRSHRALKRTQCPTFRVGARRDFMCVVAPLMTDLGLCPSHNLSFDVYWGYSLNSLDAFGSRALKRHAPADAIISSVPLLLQLVGEKPSLANLQHECFKQLYRAHGQSRRWPVLEERSWCSFTQPGFNARREDERAPVLLQYHAMNAFCERRVNSTGRFPTLWIVKPIHSYSQQGIKLVALRTVDLHDQYTFAHWAERRLPKGDFTLQYYTPQPMLWKDRKFDMRVLALITSVRPLRFYVLDHAFPKIATRPYTTDVTSIGDACIHFKMPVCDKPVKPYPRSTSSAHFRTHLVPPLKTLGEWDTRLHPAMYVTLLKVILMARSQLLDADRTLCERGYQHKRVQLLQPDMIFDAAGHAHVIEMNTNGFMVGALHKEFFDATLQIRSALEIAGVGGYPLEGKYRFEKARVMGEYCAGTTGQELASDVELAARRIPASPAHCTERLRDACEAREGDAISTLLDEWCHAGRWLPVWPPRDERIFNKVVRLYTDVSQPLLRDAFWSQSDGQMLRFARWLQRESREARGGALDMCDAAAQRIVENRTLPTPSCRCSETGRRPTLKQTAEALSLKHAGEQECWVKKPDTESEGHPKHDPRDPIAPPEHAMRAFTARMPVRNMDVFPPDYKADPFDPTLDNTADFEEARKSDFRMDA